jgi:hypothetical protein
MDAALVPGASGFTGTKVATHSNNLGFVVHDVYSNQRM